MVVNKLGEVKLTRNNIDINKYNYIIYSIIQSNNDIAFIPNRSNALAKVFYISNYIIKLFQKQY
jgi:hypothetical protein